MKKIFIFGLSTLLPFFMLSEANAQMPATSSSMKSSSSSSSSMQPLKPLEQLKSESSTSSPKEQLPGMVKPPTLFKQQAQYLHPGILVFFNGKWEGSDHLLNISNNIGVNVTIVKPEKEAIDITEGQIQKTVEDIFSQAAINPQTLVQAGRPPLPTFQVEIFVYPIEKGYVAACQGRLFEAVTLDRFKMDSNMAFQAITWENQHLIVGPKAQFAEQLTKIVEEIAKSFAERFQTYQRLKVGEN